MLKCARLADGEERNLLDVVRYVHAYILKSAIALWHEPRSFSCSFIRGLVAAVM